MYALVLIAAVVVGTWNGNWFPSGRAEHRAHPDVEAATISASAKMLASGLRALDPEGTNDVILCLGEMRGPRAVSNLVAQIGRKGLRVVQVSGYRRRDRYDQQQNAIATTLPVAEAHWSRWRGKGKDLPPRGYSFAAVVIDPATTANVYSVHLKSNYGATSEDVAESNRAKRAAAVSQMVEGERPKRGRPARPVIIAGDMNADRWRKEFAKETMFDILDDAGYSNPLADLPADSRGTHPSGKWGDSALDYVFLRGLRSVRLPHIEPNDGLSDHFALFTLVAP